ncbi:MAG: ATP-binding protein [Candidatus Methanomethylicaceae archaeon]
MGGFPETVKFGKRTLPTIYSDVIEKDVIKRHCVKKERTFKELARYLVSNSSSEFTYSRLGRLFDIKDVHTVKNYVEYIRDSYLIVTVERFSRKLKESFIAPKKAYCVDTGIINSIGFKISENVGRLMENAVAVELLRERAYGFYDWDIFYWKDYQHHEVDFIIRDKERGLCLMQVTYASSKDEIERRELEGLLKASEELGSKDLLIITWDLEDSLSYSGKIIKFLPLWKWLLIRS